MSPLSRKELAWARLSRRHGSVRHGLSIGIDWVRVGVSSGSVVAGSVEQDRIGLMGRGPSSGLGVVQTGSARRAG